MCRVIEVDIYKLKDNDINPGPETRLINIYIEPRRAQLKDLVFMCIYPKRNAIFPHNLKTPYNRRHRRIRWPVRDISEFRAIRIVAKIKRRSTVRRTRRV